MTVMSLSDRRVVLDNGVTVLCHHEPGASAGAVYVHHPVGSDRDPDDRHGLAHLVEHVMFRDGSSGHIATVEGHGGTASAATAVDRTD